MIEGSELLPLSNLKPHHPPPLHHLQGIFFNQRKPQKRVALKAIGFPSAADSFDPLSCVTFPRQPDLRNLHENAWLPEMLAGK
jgi:hypothetical protein